MYKNKYIYLYSSGELKIKDKMIYFNGVNGGKNVNPKYINEIYILGEVNFGKNVLEFMAKWGITLHVFNYYGYYSGSFYPKWHHNFCEITIKQGESYLNYRSRIRLAKIFVDGAIKNILQVLKYYQNRGKELGQIIDNIDKLYGTIGTCETTSELMAIEGNIRNHYYRAFDIIIADPHFVFERRTRRPPKNFLNTLISFGNSMLYTLVLSQIYYSHLDPRIGYLHTTNFRRYTLNLDVAEIFKPIIVDRVIFTLLNRKMITRKNFEQGSGGIILKDKGRETYVQVFEEKLNSRLRLKKTGNDISYRDLIRIDLNKLEEDIKGKEEYKPFVARW